MTRASGDASDTIGRPVDNGQLGILDPDGRAIGLHLYDGLLKVRAGEGGLTTCAPQSLPLPSHTCLVEAECHSARGAQACSALTRLSRHTHPPTPRQVVPVDERGALGAEMFNCRLEELCVIDMAFLAGCPVPTVAVLYEDAKHARHIKTYAVGMRSKVRRSGRGSGGAGLVVLLEPLHVLGVSAASAMVQTAPHI